MLSVTREPKSWRWLLALVVASLGIQTLAQGPPAGAGARVDISGDWAVTRNEDQPHRGPGPELGDYTGLPINAAARQKAEAWDATILSQPERQTQAHPVQYWMQGPGPALRAVKILDPVTQQQVAYTLAGGFGRADRIVWLDGRNHPSDFSEHTWDGFSTGRWEGGAFVTTTTHMKQGVLQRNGVASSPSGVYTERYFRHGIYLTLFFAVDDPVFLEEQFVRTTNWTWNPAGNMAFGNTFESVDELGDKPLGWVPYFPMGMQQREYAEVHNIPFKATQGGKENTYPEYMLKIPEFAKEEAAEKAAKAAAEKKQPARR